MPGRDDARVRICNVDIAGDLTEKIAEPPAAIVVIASGHIADLGELLDPLEMFEVAAAWANCRGGTPAVRYLAQSLSPSIALRLECRLADEYRRQERPPTVARVGILRPAGACCPGRDSGGGTPESG